MLTLTEKQLEAVAIAAFHAHGGQDDDGKNLRQWDPILRQGGQPNPECQRWRNVVLAFCDDEAVSKLADTDAAIAYAQGAHGAPPADPTGAEKKAYARVVAVVTDELAAIRKAG